MQITMLCFTIFPFFRVPVWILLQKKSLHREFITFEQIAIIYIYVNKILFNQIGYLSALFSRRPDCGHLYAKLYICSHNLPCTGKLWNVVTHSIALRLSFVGKFSDNTIETK